MSSKRVLRFFFTLITIIVLFVIGFNIATHTDDADMSVLAQDASTQLQSH